MRILFVVLFLGLWLDSGAFAQAESPPVPESESRPALDRESRPALDRESRPALDSESRPAPWLHHVGIIKGAAFNATSCEGTLDSLQETLQAVNWNDFSNEDLKLAARGWLDQAWFLRQRLHRKLADNGKECALKTRQIFHLLRDFEDYVSEFTTLETKAARGLDPKTVHFQTEAIPILDPSPPYYSLRTQDESFQFQSGDLMLARGISFISAIIAQISDNRSHYSHTVLVSVGGADHTQRSTIESYIGSGVAKYDLPFALKNENVRLLLLRLKNEALAARAAEEALSIASQKLPYDYQLNDEDSKAMSCVEVPVYAFRKASNNTLTVPLYPANVTIENAAFTNRLGISKGVIRTPDDFEIDENFELIADWQDLRLLRDSRHKDAVLAEMLRWISDLKYNFHDNFKSYFAMYVIKPLRATFLWPQVKEWLSAPDIDENVPRETLGLMTLLDQVGHQLLAKLRARDAEHLLTHGRPMTNQQLRDTLESYRISDAVQFTEGGSSEFHKIFRP